jgi:hypothetical protein
VDEAGVRQTLTPRSFSKTMLLILAADFQRRTNKELTVQPPDVWRDFNRCLGESAFKSSAYEPLSLRLDKVRS